MTTENEMLVKTLCKDGCRLDENTFTKSAGLITNADLAGVTATAAEISQLHEQGAVTTDFAKLHAVTSSAAELNLTDGYVADAADGLGLAKVAVATYDFAEHGGVVGAIDLGVTIPDNSIVLDGLIDVITTCTSANDSGTMAIHVNAANDIVTAIAISNGGNPWDAGLHDIIPVGTAATAKKTTAARAITATIGTQDFTAGKFLVILRYVVTV